MNKLTYEIHTAALNRWPSILRAAGMTPDFLKNVHGPCPLCEGKDRFRFDDKEGRGTFYCTHCGAGNGVDLLMKFRNVDFKGAVKIIREILPQTTITSAKKERSKKALEANLLAMWNEAAPLTETHWATRYLRYRGLTTNAGGDTLRTHPGLVYRDEDGKDLGTYPAMLAAIRDKNGYPTGIHRTYLHGATKAPVPQPRKALGKINPGCAIRLAEIVDGVLGVAEGIETALAASQMFHVPVWSLISAGQMEKFEWPSGVKKLIVFGDNDASYTGQKAAYTLAYRAKAKGLNVVVALASEMGHDFADDLRDGG